MTLLYIILTMFLTSHLSTIIRLKNNRSETLNGKRSTTVGDIVKIFEIFVLMTHASFGSRRYR